MENLETKKKDLKTKLFEALGQVSMCWFPKPSDLKFDSSNAERIGNQLLKEIEDEIRETCIAFGEFRIFERDKLMKLKEEGKTNLGYISFNEWYNTIYKK